jgi:hypothetical protein
MTKQEAIDDIIRLLATLAVDERWLQMQGLHRFCQQAGGSGPATLPTSLDEVRDMLFHCDAQVVLDARQELKETIDLLDRLNTPRLLDG